MSMLIKGLARGVTAGAAGTTALNAASGLDAFVRARPASDAPQRLVAELAGDADVSVPGNRKQRRRRVEALGPLSGTATGLALGALAGGLRAAGLRLPTVVGGPLLAVVAMLATDGPLALTGVSDPREWTGADWAADVLPHLAYGVTTHRTLVALTPGEERPARLTTLARAAALGAASGARSSAGVTALALTSCRDDPGAVAKRLGSSAGKVASGVLALGEAVADKHPATPERTAPQGTAPRVLLGATAAGGVAVREGDDPDLPALIGALAAIGATLAGLRLRTAAHHRFGTDLPGALAEDVVAAVLGWLGARRSRSTPGE
ncbi:hypothetical protein VA596_15600 [Amycolatopsis sp., V23-08]|uniref:DUF4126 domain-containing protein n=1 Tax=Amycolatopsis heterodermiae TaxID=3110235 RepID=A0ABU5R448_9PSEU|nr:hypothetical protein [Amycolatopsis sp., V23-08]MEA5360972.1 hypothetical protein [Amycolatopsis sp., V23-08]